MLVHGDAVKVLDTKQPARSAESACAWTTPEDGCLGSSRVRSLVGHVFGRSGKLWMTPAWGSGHPGSRKMPRTSCSGHSGKPWMAPARGSGHPGDPLIGSGQWQRSFREGPDRSRLLQWVVRKPPIGSGLLQWAFQEPLDRCGLLQW